MNILFISLLDFNTIEVHNLYTDLLREFRNHGHNIFVVSPIEKRKNGETRIIEEENTLILKVRIGNIQKTNILEKGISTILLENQLIHGIKKYFAHVKFDLVLYPTPPITVVKAVKYIKKRDNARTYLLLKDIFPQNAVDLGMMKKTGVKGLIYKFFRNKEKKLYAVSDRIGCMSQANVNYILRYNPEIENSKVEISPNCVEVVDNSIDENMRVSIKRKYGIPLDKVVFVYGGNLGKPQGIDFLIECIKSQNCNNEVFFLVIGDGTEYTKLESFVKDYFPNNMKLMKRLPKEEYDIMIEACDIGMIFLDYRFTIPNFPSRLLSYMQAKLPVLACTDKYSDVGKVVEDGGFGWWCESNDLLEFNKKIEIIVKEKGRRTIGETGYQYLKEHYNVAKEYVNIMTNW